MRPQEADRLQSDYHGLEMLPTKDSCSFYGRMLTEPDSNVLVKKPMGCAAGTGNGGLFGDSGYKRSQNPYLQQKYFEYTEEIRPVKIAKDLMVLFEFRKTQSKF